MQVPSRLPGFVRRGLRFLAGCAVLSGTLACGYKGPLYLPPPENPPAALTEPPTAPAPARPSAN